MEFGRLHIFALKDKKLFIRKETTYNDLFFGKVSILNKSNCELKLELNYKLLAFLLGFKKALVLTIKKY